MLMKADNSCLLLVDVQEKLINLIHEHQKVTSNCCWLIALAQELNIPILASEQYPKGLGHTVASLKELLTEDSFIEKFSFSCMSDSAAQNRVLAVAKEQFIIAGIEAHVCVLQTAMDLFYQDKEVFVVADSIGSRSVEDKDYALARMAEIGIQIVTKEMVFFEWMHTSAHPRFKDLSKKFLRSK